MAVTAPGGMAVQVGIGDLLNKGTLHPIYTAETVNISAADATNPRIDIVVSELTRTGTFEGRVRLQVVEGTPAASPAPPTLTDDATTSEIEVARVTVPAAAGAIVLGNIDTTERPIATGPLADGSVTQAKLAKPSVGTPELFDGAVTLAKLADGVLVPGMTPGLIDTFWVSARQVIGPTVLAVIQTIFATDTVYATPVYIPAATTMTGIAVRRVSGSASSATGRLGLWQAASNGLPGTLHHDCGTVDLNTIDVKSVTGLSVALPAGWYWGSINCGTFAGSLGFSSVEAQIASSEGQTMSRGLFGDASPDAPTPLFVAQAVLVGTDALPGTFPAPGLAEEAPIVWVQTSGT